MAILLRARILVFAGSIRTGAYSAQTADRAQKALALQGADVTRILLGDYPLPLMDEDLEAEKGVPDMAVQLARQIMAHDGILIASPEYNASIPPLLKNAIDWVSRVRKEAGHGVKPFGNKVVALCSASDGTFAGIRGLYHLRAVLMNCGADVITPQCSVSRAKDAFDRNGDFKDEKLRSQMDMVASTLVERAKALSTRIEP